MKKTVASILVLILVLSLSCAVADSAYISTGVSRGSTLYFGAYEQDGNRSNGVEPIEWLVIDADGNHALLITSYGLEAKAYNDFDASVIWSECTLRKWLNGSFYDAAFSAAEQQLIEETYCPADSNPGYQMANPGGSTYDKVFILSALETNQYFKTMADRKTCYPTTAAKQNGAFVNKTNGTCCWWLRTPGSKANYSCCVSSNVTNYVNYQGNDVRDRDNCVRPVIWVTLGVEIEDISETVAPESNGNSSNGAYSSPYGRR